MDRELLSWSAAILSAPAITRRELVGWFGGWDADRPRPDRRVVPAVAWKIRLHTPRSRNQAVGDGGNGEC